VHTGGLQRQVLQACPAQNVLQAELGVHHVGGVQSASKQRGAPLLVAVATGEGDAGGNMCAGRGMQAQGTGWATPRVLRACRPSAVSSLLMCARSSTHRCLCQPLVVNAYNNTLKDYRRPLGVRRGRGQQTSSNASQSCQELGPALCRMACGASWGRSIRNNGCRQQGGRRGGVPGSESMSLLVAMGLLGCMQVGCASCIQTVFLQVRGPGCICCTCTGNKMAHCPAWLSPDGLHGGNAALPVLPQSTLEAAPP
jgi:hypothetical protein